MGQSEVQNTQIDPNFPMHIYLNQGLNKNQILMIRQVFYSYQPTNGLIDSTKYKESLLQCQLREVAMTKLANKKTLTFEEFFQIEKEVLLLQLKNNPGIEVDSTQVEPPSNILCPYAQEVVRN